MVTTSLRPQAAAYHLVRGFPWYTPFEPTSSTDYACLENFAVFCVSMFQYVIMAVAYSQGAPYRASILTNRWFSASLVLMVAMCTYITVWPAGWVQSLLELAMPPSDFRGLVVALAAANMVVCLFFEKVVVQWLVQHKLRYCCHDVSKSRRRYLAVGRDLRDAEGSWPRLEDSRGAATLLAPLALPTARVATVLRARPSAPAPSTPAVVPAAPAVPTISQAVSEKDRLEMTRL